ncbi:hypothetical protein Tco_0001249 [Tanacetum coccineum]
MVGRSTRSNTDNNTNPPNKTTDEVTRELNAILPNLLTQLVQSLRGNRANQRDVAQSCSIKTFRASGAKEFFGTEGVVGLLTLFESIKSVLHITKCPTESQVKFAASMLQGRALTWWNTLLESEFWNHKMVGSDIDRYKARFHELASAGNKRRSNDQTRNQGRDDRSKRQRTGGNFALTVDSWYSTHLYSNPNADPDRMPLTKANGQLFECGDPNQFRRNCPRMNRATTSGGNHPNPVLSIEGNTNQGNNRNRGRVELLA